MSIWQVQGMGRGKVPADWPGIGEGEAAAVLEHYPSAGRLNAVRWRSPRPMSAGALVSVGRGTILFVKRHHRSVRDAAGLGEEHAFAAHLRGQGIAGPEVLATSDGATAVCLSDWVYEVLERAPGVDAYRDVPSWEPYSGVGHAAAAGRALARFHTAAASYGGPRRQPGVLCPSDVVVRANDAMSAIGDLVARRPALAGALERWPWRRQISDVVALIEAGAPLVAPPAFPMGSRGLAPIKSVLVRSGTASGGGRGDGSGVGQPHVRRPRCCRGLRALGGGLAGPGGAGDGLRRPWRLPRAACCVRGAASAG